MQMPKNNMLIVGGPKSEEPQNHILPLLKEGEGSFVIHDIGGRLLQAEGTYLSAQGYDIRVLNLCNIRETTHYNPFTYIETPDDVYQLAETIINYTNINDGQENPPSDSTHIYNKAELTLLAALLCYVVCQNGPEERSFTKLFELLSMIDVPFDSNRVDNAFKELKENAQKKPSIFRLEAVKAYDEFKALSLFGNFQSSGIWISLVIRLGWFHMPAAQKITDTDNLDLSALRKNKTALFIITHPSERVHNILAAILVNQIILIAGKDTSSDGIPVHIMLDECRYLGLASIFTPPQNRKWLFSVTSEQTAIRVK